MADPKPNTTGVGPPDAESAAGGIYLDYNGSAPLDPRVAEVMSQSFADGVGNASASHRFGRRQAARVDAAREQTAALTGGRPADVIFTAGATEANNLALCGAAAGAPPHRARILVSAVEHASVSRAARWLNEQGLAKTDVIPVTAGGFVDPDELQPMLGDDVLLVSVMAANSETGVLNPIGEIAERTHAAGALLHCDATQLAGRLPFNMSSSGVDLVSISGHKICGPGGVGALIGTRRSLPRLRPVTHGGGHERGLRSGSLNAAGIAGLGEAARLALMERESESARVGRLRDRLRDGLQQGLVGVSEAGDASRRLPNTVNLRFAGADAEAVLVNMDPVAASAGSACSSGSIAPSETLLAMGFSPQAAFESIRFSLGRFTTSGEMEQAVPKIVTAVDYVRSMTGETA